MSHITKTREEVLKLGTANEDGTITFDAFLLQDALIDLYGQAFRRGVTEFSEGMERAYKEKANETV